MPTLTVYPDASPETDSCDGYIQYENLSGVSWSLAHDSPVGNWAQTDGNFIQARVKSDAATDKWETIARGFMGFLTSALPAECSISELEFEGYLTHNSDPWSTSINIVSASPASDTALVNGDYNSLGTVFATKTIASMTQFTWETFGLDAAGIAAVDKNGVTTLGTRLGKDINDDDTWQASSDCNLYFYSSDQGGYDPRLVITYSTVKRVNLILGIWDG